MQVTEAKQKKEGGGAPATRPRAAQGRLRRPEHANHGVPVDQADLHQLRSRANVLSEGSFSKGAGAANSIGALTAVWNDLDASSV